MHMHPVDQHIDYSASMYAAVQGIEKSLNKTAR